MKAWFSSGISKKVLIAGTAYTLVLFGIFVIASATLVKRTSLDHLEASAELAVTYLKDKFVSAMEHGESFKDVGVEYTDVINWSTYPEYRRLFRSASVVENKTGTILSHSDPYKIFMKVDEATFKLLKTINKTETIQVGEEYQIYIPVLHRNQIVGFIMLSYSTELVNSKVQQVIFIAAGISVISLIVLVIISFLGVRKLITDPIEEITEGLNTFQLSEGASPSLQASGKDEIGMLIRDVNRFVTAWSEQHNQQIQNIQAHNSQLNGMLNHLHSRSQSLHQAVHSRTPPNLSSESRTAELTTTSVLPHSVAEPLKTSGLILDAAKMNHVSQSLDDSLHEFPHLVRELRFSESTDWNLERPIRVFLGSENSELIKRVLPLFQDWEDWDFVIGPPMVATAKTQEAQQEPDIFLLDADPVENAWEVAQSWCSQFPKMAIVFISENAEPCHVVRFTELQNASYLDKRTFPQNIVPLLYEIVNGSVFITGKAGKNYSRITPFMRHLAPEEWIVFEALVWGWDAKDIAQHYNKSVNTARSQIKSVLKKSGFPNKEELYLSFQ